jgi:hypothetical protein
MTLRRPMSGLARVTRAQGGKLALLLALVLGVGLVSCASALPKSGSQASDSGQPVALPTAAPTSQPATTATAAPSVTPALTELLVLHTNDNWGETEPCG